MVIVLGVLVALGLESAWQAQQDRRREASLIQNLTVEFRQNRNLLLNDLDRNRTEMARAEDWGAAELTSGALPSDAAYAFMQGSMGIFRFDPDDGVLRSGLETGGLELIRSDELRSALSGWLSRVAEARQTALDMTHLRNVLWGEIFDTVEGSGSEFRRQLVLRTHARMKRDVIGQQERLLHDLEEILSLLEEVT